MEYGRMVAGRSPPLRTGFSSRRSADPLMQARLLAPPWTVNSRALLLRHRSGRLTTSRGRRWHTSGRYRRIGSDCPYRTASHNTMGVTEFFKGDDLKAVDRENVIRLIPGLKTI